MCWNIADKADFQSIKRFLMEHESGCVSASARFKACGLPFEKSGERSAVILKKDPGSGRIQAAVLVTQHGLVLPTFDETCIASIDREQNVLKQMFSRYEDILHSIMGTDSSVAAMQGVFRLKPSDSVEYFLLTLRPGKYIPPKNGGDTNLIIRQATIRDAENIFPLQKEYELEEVFLDPGRWNERFSFSNLKQTLKREIVFIAEYGGAIIAKAGTNARGFSFEQIGGVYTAREMRRKGIASITVGALLENIFRRKMSASLFVKKRNPGAVSLYRRIGFELEDNFRISYYFNNAPIQPE